MKKNKKLESIAALLLICFLSVDCFAYESHSVFPSEDKNVEGHASEFVYRNDPEEILIPIYLLGAVSKPGLYHVPTHTDLISLLTLSGGPIPDAELDHVEIRRSLPDRTFRVTNIDFTKIVSDPIEPSPTLVSNDVVYIPMKKPIVSSNTVLVVGLASTVITLILAAVLVSRSNN
jgi:hypothetical protein